VELAGWVWSALSYRLIPFFSAIPISSGKSFRRRSQPELRTPGDGHDETCVGDFFAVFRHRDKSSAPPRVMRRLARLQRTNLQVTIGRCKETSGPRTVSSRLIPARKTPQVQPRFDAMDTDYQFGFGASLLAHEIAAIGQRGSSPHSMHFIVKRACSSARSIG
jgi:hypothetical protein